MARFNSGMSTYVIRAPGLGASSYTPHTPVSADARTLLSHASLDEGTRRALRHLLAESAGLSGVDQLSDHEVLDYLASLVGARRLVIVAERNVAGPATPVQPAAPQPPPSTPPAPPKPKPKPSKPPLRAALDVTVLLVDGGTETPLDGIKVQLGKTGSGSATSASGTGIAEFPSLAPGPYTAAVDLTADQKQKYKAPKKKESTSLAPGDTGKLTIKVRARKLVLVSVDDHFAPGHESLDIKYTISGLDDEPVKLKITSPYADANPLVERDLTDAEKTDGDHTIQWDGKPTYGGKLKDHFVHPLLSPYTAEVRRDASLGGEKPFKVLYHSLKLRQGPWTHDEAEPAKGTNDWVQYKLNELGYFGGPVGKDTDSYLHRAVIRYKANHGKMRQTFYTSYNDTVDATLTAALDAGDNKRTYLTGDAITNPKGSSKIFVEALTYEVTGVSPKGRDISEFSQARPPKEQDRLNRPLIPLEVDVLLKAKDDSAVSSPPAVGPVRVNWKFVDPDEDLTKPVASTAASPTRARTYVENAVKTKNGRSGTNGDNCHKDYGGIRDTPDPYYAAAFLDGDFYEPYTVQKDAGQKVVWCTACVDDAKYPKRLGRAGVYFRPSYIAGDDYKLTAEIDFTGLPNQGDLEGFHGATDPTKRIHVDSGTFQIWRSGKVALSVGWPARTNSHDWNLIHDEFARAYVDVDMGGIATKKITDVLTEAQYKAVVTANTKYTAAEVSLNPGALLGVKMPGQGWFTTASSYETALKTLANDFWDAIVYPLRRQISANVRTQFPSGFIIIDFLSHPPVNVKRFLHLGTSDANWVAWTFSIGLADSVVFADQKDPDKVYYVVGHEMGHNFWLHHYEHAGGSKPAEHDTSDHDCIMSYSDSSSSPTYPFQAQGVYAPHFCGKCLLKLRGWDVDTAGLLPASS